MTEEGAFTWTVGGLAEWVGTLVASSFPEEIWIEGEVHDLNRSARGHVYFTLIEAGDDRRSARHLVRVTLFEWHRKLVNNTLRRAGGAVRMEDGVRLRIRGQVEYYAPKGEVRVRMTSIDPTFTLGNLATEREALLRRLADDGALAANGSLPLARFPLRVALVTSVGSAAYHDVMSELDACGIGFEVLVVDSLVQGVDAPASLVAALALAAAAAPDVVLLVRGGGARTDLAAFDDEAVARAVAASSAVVWTGIGHEVDTSVADAVAHRAWKTPTACAAGLVQHVYSARDELDRRWVELAQRAAQRLERADDALVRRRARVALSARTDLELSADRMDERSRRLVMSASAAVGAGRDHAVRAASAVEERAAAGLDRAGTTLARGCAELARLAPRAVHLAGRSLDARSATVRAHDPARALARGYSVTRTPDGRAVRRLGDAPPGTTLSTVVADGTIISTVQQHRKADT